MKSLFLKILKRVMWLALSLMMTAGAIPASAISGVDTLLGNTKAGNQSILTALQNFDGSDAQTIAMLQQLGLMDAQGNLLVNQTINLDGQDLTLIEAEALVNDPATDLTRVATVDGTPIALGDLGTIIQIEDKLQQVKDKYFTGRTFTPEEQANLQGMMSQIQTDGISVTATDVSASFTVGDSAQPAAPDNVLTVLVAPDPSNPSATITYSATNTVTLKYNLSLTGNLKDGQVYSFSWDKAAGLVPDAYFTASMTAVGTNGPVNIPDGGCLTIGAADSGAAITVNTASDFSAVVTVNVGNSVDLDTALSDTPLDGTFNLYVEFYDAVWVLISGDNGATNASQYQVPISVYKPNAFPWGPRQMSIQSSGSYTSNLPYTVGAPLSWTVLDMSAPNSPSGTDYDHFMATKEDIFGSRNLTDGPVYKISAGLALLDPAYGVTMPDGAIHYDAAYNCTKLPSPVTANNDTSPVPLTVLRYNFMEGANNSGSYGDGFLVYNWSTNPIIHYVGPGAGSSYITNLTAPAYISCGGTFLSEASAGSAYAFLNHFTVTCKGAKGDNPPLSLTLPGAPTFYTGVYQYGYTSEVSSAPASYTPSDQLKMVSDSPKISLAADPGFKPSVTDIVVKSGAYATGQLVPIVLTFNTPVRANQLTLTINGVDYNASELKMGGTTSRKAVAYYTVKAADNAALVITAVKNITSIFQVDTGVYPIDNLYTQYLSGNIGYPSNDIYLSDPGYPSERAWPAEVNPSDNGSGGAGWEFSGAVTLKSLYLRNAGSSLGAACNNGATIVPQYPQPGYVYNITASDAVAGVKYTLSLKQGDYLNIYNSAILNQKTMFGIRLVAGNSSGDTYDSGILPMAMSGNSAAVYNFSGLKVFGRDVTYTAQIYAYDDGTPGTPVLMPGMSFSFLVHAVVFVNSASLNIGWDTSSLNITSPPSHMPQLIIGLPAAGFTFSGGTWSSSNQDIAKVDQNGNISMTGVAFGNVTFTWTASNGGVADPSGAPPYSITSHAFNVSPGDTVMIKAPPTVTTRQNLPVTVTWVSNVSAFEPDGTTDTYKIDVYAGNFSSVPTQQAVYTTTADLTESYVSLPANLIANLGTSAYTVFVSVPNPLIAGTLTSYTHINVLTNPAAARMDPPDDIYMPDNGAAKEIDWSIDGYTSATTGTFSIDRISGANSVKTNFYTQTINGATGASGAYLFTPVTAGMPRDTYMVTMSVTNNAAADGYSIASFPLYVYHNGALQLTSDGTTAFPGGAVNLDNHGKVSGALPTGTAAILSMRQTLGLMAYIGVNYDQYAWNQMKDGMKWQTSDGGVVTVNIRQGTAYADVSDFGPDAQFTPQTVLALDGLRNGSATVTATHANTGMTASVTVTVSTLKNQFYMFQMIPAQTTNLTYKNGSGQARSVDTNADGVLALYEPDGINSDIQLKAMGADGSVWLGSIGQSAILSGEGNATKLQIYPLNTYKLRQAAKTAMYLKKADGTPYTGNVTLRGGVYKNGFYCPSAEMSCVSALSLHSGCVPETVPVGADGKLTVYMNAGQFLPDGDNSDLLATDNLQYIFELSGMNGECPALVYSNGNLTPAETVYSADNLVTLITDASGMPAPIISNQTASYGASDDNPADVRDTTYHIGPTSDYPSVTVDTTLMLWGEDTDGVTGYSLEMLDQYGAPAPVQSGGDTVMKYPFSSVNLIRNTLTLTPQNMTDSGWIPEGKDVGLRERLSKNGVMISDLPVTPRIVDFTNLSVMQDTTDLGGVILDVEDASALPANLDFGNISTGNSITDSLIGFLGIGNTPSAAAKYFKMLVVPGDAPDQFNFLLWGGYNGVGLSDLPYNSDGWYYAPELVQKQSKVSGATVGKISTAKNLLLNGSTYINNLQSQLDSQKRSLVNGQILYSQTLNTSYELAGGFNGVIKYNYSTGKWDCVVLGGGFDAGFGFKKTYTMNSTVGPIPITASLSLGASVQLSFKAALRSGVQTDPGGNQLAWSSSVSSQDVNDYLTALRVQAYVDAFAGFGFDLTVVALKIGVFGKVTADFESQFLSRTYLDNSSERQTNGQDIRITGEIGIKFVAKFLFFSYETVLASASGGYNRSFNDWNNITGYWNQASAGLAGGMSSGAANASMFGGAFGIAAAGGLAGEALGNAADMGLSPVSETTTLESRDYLERFARSWGADGGGGDGSLFMAASASLDNPNGISGILQTNAYPQSNPLVSDDGKQLVYINDQGSTDISKTRIFAGTLNSGQYSQGAAVNFPQSGVHTNYTYLVNNQNTTFTTTGYGDMQPTVAGSPSEFELAAWVREAAELPSPAPDGSVSSAAQMQVLNGTEIYAADCGPYTNGWEPWLITYSPNAAPDMVPYISAGVSGAGAPAVSMAPVMAPAVATSGKNYATSQAASRGIIAWRSVTPADASDPLNFNATDIINYIFCSSMRGGISSSGWSGVNTLYNGIAGAVKGLSVAMMSYNRDPNNASATIQSNPACIAYAIDTSGAGDAGGAVKHEIGYSIVDPSNSTVYRGILTADDWMNENPQVTTVRLSDTDQRFIIAWRSEKDGQSYIRLACVGRDGSVDNNFIDAIPLPPGAGSQFQFARIDRDANINSNGNYNNPITNIALLWNQTVQDDQGQPDHDEIVGVKFRSTAGVSAPQTMAELPPQTFVDSFDAYVAGPISNTVKTVIQATAYSTMSDDPSTYETYTADDGTVVYVPTEETMLYTATGTFENTVSVDGLMLDFSNLCADSITPVQFTVTNQGLDALDSVTISIDGQTSETFNNLNIAPGASAQMTALYTTGGALENAPYTLTAAFGSNSTPGNTVANLTDTQTGMIFLDYPDLGISQMQTLSESEGLRTIRVTLYNASDAKLAGKGRTVNIGFYDDSLLGNLQRVSCSTPGVTVNADNTLSIAGDGAMSLIDEGAFSMNIAFDVGAYMGERGFDEIPDSGMRLFANVWTTEDNADGTVIMPEYDQSDNSASVLFENPVARTGQTVSTGVQQGVDAEGNTTAVVSLHNNSLQPNGPGNLVVSLMDGGGDILEQRQTYVPGNDDSIIDLSGEGDYNSSFTFDQAGARVVALYGLIAPASSDNSDASLSALTFDGLPAFLTDFTDDGDGNMVCSVSTARASTVVSFVTANQNATVTVDGLPANGSANVNLTPNGDTEITIQVTAPDNITVKTYILTVHSRATATIDKIQQAAVSISGLDTSYAYGDAAFDISLSGGDGGGAVTYVSDAPGVASVSDIGNDKATVTIHKAGTFAITAAKAGDENYLDTSVISDEVTVSEASPTVALAGSNVSYGATPTIRAVVSKPIGGAGATPEGTVTFKEGSEILAADVPLVYGEASYTPETPPDAGDHTYTAEYSGQTGYYKSAAGNCTLGVGKIDQTGFYIIDCGEKTYGDADFNLFAAGGQVATASSLFTVPDTDVISVTSSGAITIRNAGTVIVTAYKAGNVDYNAVTATMVVTVNPRDINLANVTVTGGAVYTGNQLQPAFTVSDSAAINAGDYTNDYGENVNAGTGAGSITLTGQRNYTGTKSVTFDILPKTVDFAPIPGVTLPEGGGAPVSAITPTEQYSGAVSWTPNDASFKANTTYMAQITLTPAPNYTMTGVPADFFTVTGATSAANAAGSGGIFASFVTDPYIQNQSALPDGVSGSAYSSTLFSEGIIPLTWRVSGGILPGGLSLNALTGEISGVPAATGRFNFTVTVSNGITPGAVKTFSVTIKEAAAETPTPTPPEGSGTDTTPTPPGNSRPGATPAPNTTPPPAVTPTLAGWVNPFTDLQPSDWYYGDVEYAVANGLMVGTNLMQFSPNMHLTRGMVATILWRLAGSPDATGMNDPFIDVLPGKWYTAAVEWAAENGIVVGIKSGEYAPDANITRQDLAVILDRYAKSADIRLQVAKSYTRFKDDADISSYAKDAIEALFRAGIINGYPDDSFRSRNEITRAEAAAVLHRLLAEN